MEYINKGDEHENKIISGYFGCLLCDDDFR